MLGFREVSGRSALTTLWIDGDRSEARLNKNIQIDSPVVRSGRWIALHGTLPRDVGRTRQADRMWRELKMEYERPLGVLYYNDYGGCVAVFRTEAVVGQSSDRFLALR